MSRLRQRNFCPSCGSFLGDEILSLAYETDPLRSFLTAYYPKINLSYLQGGVYSLRHCDYCHLIYQQGVPDDELVRALYEDWIDAAASRAKKHLFGHWGRYRRLSEELCLAKALLGPIRYTPRVLDFGLGWGEWLKMAAAYGCETYGVELSRKKVEHAKAAGISVMTLEALPAEHFDFINMEQVLEHLIDPWETVRRLAASLRSGGFLQISVPNGNGMLKKVGRLSWTNQGRAASMAVHPLEHLNCFSHHALVKLGERAGLREVQPSLRLAYRTQLAFDDLRVLARSILRPMVRKFIKVPKVIFQKPKDREKAAS